MDSLNALGLAVSYDKLLRIENDLAVSIEKIENETGGFVAPVWLRYNHFLCFAIDNIDFNEATYSGKDSLHGTALCVFQDKMVDTDHKNIEFVRTKSKSKSSKYTLPCMLSEFEDPVPKANVYTMDVNSFKSEYHSENSDLTRLWMSTFFNVNGVNDSKVLTWSGFNSRYSKKFKPIKNIGLIAPLMRSPPTQYDALHACLMQAERINTKFNGPDCVTVVGLDMQLYDMAMRFWVTDENIRKRFFFVAGQLHTVFWMLQNIGTYIKGTKRTFLNFQLYIRIKSSYVYRKRSAPVMD